MTSAIAQRPRGAAGTRPITHTLAGRVRNVISMTRRNLVHISREPMQLSDVTIQPVLFTVLFIYLFGGAIPIPGGGSYTDFILAGLLALNLTTSTMGTAVGLATDLHEGMIERIRVLPMWRPAVLVGRSLADLLTACLCALVVAVTGLAVGWRTSASPLSIIAGFALVLFFAYALLRQPTASPVTATTRAHRQAVSKSARERPTSTAARHIGSTRNRSMIPSCRSVAKPTAVPMVDVVRFSASSPARMKSL